MSGTSAGDRAGFSVAAGGNISGQTVGGLSQNTLLIGSPQVNTGPGQAAVIYATPGLINSGLVVNGLSLISLSRVGSSVNGIDGAIFTGTTTGDETGYSVSTAGDFNNDGVADILIGSPGFNGASGRVNMIFGRRVTTTVPPHPRGIQPGQPAGLGAAGAVCWCFRRSLGRILGVAGGEYQQ